MEQENDSLSSMIVDALFEAFDKHNKKIRDANERIDQVRFSIEMGEEASPRYKLVGELHPEILSLGLEGGCFYKLYHYNEATGEPDTFEVSLT